MTTYTFKLILAGPEAIVESINKATYDQFSYTDTNANIQGCGAGIEPLDCSLEAPSLKDAVFATVREVGHCSPEFAVIRVLAAPVPQYSEVDRRFAINIPRGHVLAKLIREHGRGGQAKDLPPLSDAVLQHWITSWYHRTRSWPTAGSGEIPGSDGEHWIDIDRALENGERGLPSSRSLAKYIAHHWGESFGTAPDPMAYVRCGGAIFRLGTVQAVTCEDGAYHPPGGSTRDLRLRLKLLISGEWVRFYGAEAERVRDYLVQTWTAGRRFVDLDARPQQPPTATAEPGTPTPPEPEPASELAPQPEPEKRRYFL